MSKCRRRNGRDSGGKEEEEEEEEEEVLSPHFIHHNSPSLANFRFTLMSHFVSQLLTASSGETKTKTKTEHSMHYNILTFNSNFQPVDTSLCRTVLSLVAVAAAAAAHY